MEYRPFDINHNGILRLNATSTAATALLTKQENSPSAAITVTNEGADIVYIRTGEVSGVTVTAATGAAILPGSQRVLFLRRTHSYIAYICPAGAVTIHVEPGEGL